MATSIVFNGVTYSIPDVSEENWGTNLSTYFIAIPQGALQKSGGNFTLSANVNFGANYGLLSAVFSTRAAHPAGAGLVRLAVGDTIQWRNNANSANLALGVNGSDQLIFNGTTVQSTLSIGALDAQTANSNGLALVSNVLSAQSADGTHPGLVNTSAQTFAGAKTFSSAPVMGALTASQLVATDSGKTLTSLAYASANTASAIVQRDGSGNFSAGTITASLTGTASGNTTITANQYGVVLSGAANILQVLVPDASTAKVLVSGGASANPAWALLTNANLSGAAGITNANLAAMASSSSTVGTVKGNISGSSSTPSDIVLTSANTNSSAVYRDGSGNFSAGTITASLTGAASLNVLKAGDTMGGILNMGSNKITNVTDPTSSQDAATKNYVDSVAAGLQPKEACYAASTANIAGTYLNGVAGVGATFTVTATGAFTIDGTTPAANSRILLKDQSSGFQNGVYDLTIAGTTGVSPVLTRSLNYNTASEINAGDLIPVTNGTVNATTIWLQTATVTTVGTDSLTFSQFSASTSYLVKTNNLSDVSNAATAFNNISGLTTLGDLVYGGTSGARSRLAGNTTTTKKYLSQTGDGANSAAPAWAQVAAADLSNGTTGSGAVVLAISPTLTTPNLGTPSAGVLTNCTALPLTTGVTGTLGTGNGGTGVTSVTTSPTASAFAGWDASSNLNANNFAENYRSQALANGTLSLVVGDAGQQYFTGSTSGQILKMPDATTLPRAGFAYRIVNLGSASIAVQDTGGNSIGTLPASSNATVTAKSIGTANGSWDLQQQVNNAGGGTVTSVTFTGDGTVLSSSPSSAVTTSGTVTGSLLTQAKNTALMGPTSGSNSAPTFRTISPIDYSIYKNYLLNGNFDFWQRGTSITGIANGSSTYGADRWYAKNSLGTNGVLRIDQTTGVSTGAIFGCQVKISTAPTASQANGCELYQTIENPQSILLYNQTASFTVQVKSLGNVNQVGIQFYYKTTEAKVDTSIGSEVLTTVNSSTFTTCTISGQALGTSQTTSGVIGVRIRITGVSSGNTYDINNGFIVEQAMLNIGSTAGAFMRSEPTTASELVACQRFYEKSYPLTVAPATNSGTTEPYFGVPQSVNHNNGNQWVICQPRFKVSKRANPSCTAYSSGTTGSWTIGGTLRATAFNVNTEGLWGYNNTGGSLTPSVSTCSGDWIADAEI